MYFKAFQLFSPPLLVTLMNLKGFLKHILCGCILKQEKERAVPSPPSLGWMESHFARRAPSRNPSNARAKCCCGSSASREVV